MDVRGYIDENTAGFFEALSQWLAIPSISADILAAPLVFLAVGLDSDRIHAPNEKAEMSLLLRDAEAAAYLWDELAAAAGDLAAAP